jgi:hypothetical protein
MELITSAWDPEGADAALFRAPANRFPEYRLFELADWLERH